MRLAIVVQRYGLEVNGGAELLARQVAEHLAPYLQVEVLTTCARDYMTWANFYPPGMTTLNRVPVRRFAVRAPREAAAFDARTAALQAGPHTYYDEIDWMARQGPDAPALFDFIRAEHGQYDLFLFTYLYATTFLGLQLVARKSLLCPTAHDEPWLYLDIYRPIFQLPRGLIFLTPEEATLVHHQFQNSAIPHTVIGAGVTVPVPPPTRRLDAEYILYLGRIDPNKGCGDLFRYFLRYKAETGDPVKLVLVGATVMDIPRHSDIVPLGFLEDAERFGWLQQARVLLMPSPYESLSIVTLEAWALGVPVLANGRTPVLKGHCLRSQAGLYYDDEDEFVAALQTLRTNPHLCAVLGARGRTYVEHYYNWGTITTQYLQFLRRIYDQVYSA